ncbi:hypothetical protein [Caminibacter mediatlanticus]|uniref:Lysozyme n=1 Tax=Caminibacter mediatlanticus TB-2 TaxID=391592 RepID=A0AAI9AG78_9BACT|nr:hypothetical protein [Caminibacter mediatlanticus]EDM22942.1 hypothetical protein CMTB2_05537 [Caminibacter mediatlanticus TB-2]
MREIFPKFDELPENVRLALIDMIFNLGKPRFLKFKKMIQAVKNRDFQKAAYEAKNSQWCRQVRGRCKDIIKLIQQKQ